MSHLEKTVRKPKKEYSRPQLTDYGSVSKLTRGGTFQGNDGNTKCSGDAASSEFDCNS